MSILEHAFINDGRNLLLKQSMVDFNKNNNQVLLFFDPKKFEDKNKKNFFPDANVKEKKPERFINSNEFYLSRLNKKESESNKNINKFKVENYTFEKVKKYAKLYGLNFLSKDYFNDIKTKHIAFR